MAKKLIENYNRRACSAKLNQFDPLAKDNDFIEVTEWDSGEGFDVDLYSEGTSEKFAMTFGEFKALKALVKHIYNASLEL